MIKLKALIQTRKWPIKWSTRMQVLTFVILTMLFMLLFLGKQLYYTLAGYHSIQSINPISEKITSENQKNLALLLSAEIELNRDNPEHALANYIGVAKNTQDPKIAERATKLALSYGSKAQAIDTARIWATQAPENIEATLTLTGLLLLKLDSTETLSYLKKLISTEKMDLDKSLLSLYRQLNDEPAQKLFQTLLTELSLDPIYAHKAESLALHLTLAELYLIENQAELGYEHSRVFADLATRTDIILPPRAHIVHAQLLFLKKQNQAAIRYLENQIKHDPSEMILRIYLLDLLIESQQLDQAKILLTNIAKLKNLSSLETLQIAKIALETEWFKEAKTFFLRLKEDEKEGSNAKYFMARIEDMENNPHAAIDWYKQVQNSPYYLNAHLRAAILLSRQDKTQEALQLLDELEPETLEEYKKIILTQSQLFLDARQYQAGYELLTKALIDLPEDEEILYARGMQAIQLKKYTQAENDFKEILKFEPNHPETLNALGYLLVENLKKPDDAYPYLIKAIQLDPNNPAIMDSLGWFYYKKDNKIEALKWLKQAFSLSNDADIAAHLSEVLYALDQSDSAQQVVYDALSRFPNAPSLIQVQQKFKAVTKPLIDKR